MSSGSPRDIVIVKPSARPSGAAAAACPPCTPPTCSAWRSRRADRPIGHRPRRGRPGRRRLRVARSAAGLQRHPHRLADRRPAHLERPATTVDSQCGSSPAGHQLRHQPGRLGRGRRGRRLRRRGHEPGADGLQPRRARRRQGDPQVLLRAVRVHDPVRGRRAHRREVGHHPRRDRRPRPPVPAAGRPGLGRGPLRHPDRRRSTPPTSARTASPRAPPTTSPSDEGLRETTLEALSQLKPVARDGRRPHRRHLVADLRRRRRRAADDPREGRGPGPHPRGPRGRHLPGRQSTRSSCSPAPSTPPTTCSSATR